MTGASPRPMEKQRSATQKNLLRTFYSIRDVAYALEVSRRTVSRWIASGELIAHRFGRSVRIADDDLRAFLAHRRGM